MQDGEKDRDPGLAPGVAADWDRAVRGVLAHDRRTAEALGRVIEAAPGFALAHALKGWSLMLLGRSELVAPARGALADARAALADHAQGEPGRARALVEGLAHWCEGRPSRAAERLDDWLGVEPADALALKLDHTTRFILGDRRGMLAATRRAMPACGADHALGGYLHGCHAFALEENGLYVEAERAGRAGLERADDDAWGLHAVAHVHDMTGRDAEGIAWLDARRAAWSHCNNFGAHVWWHLALFHLDRGAWDVVLDLYDTRIRAEHTDDYRDIANGASMLTRLELEGVDVGHRWEELAALAETRVEPGAVVFADLHYLLALEASGRRGAADRLVARLAIDAATADHDMHEVAAIAGLPAARGLTAFRTGRYAEAFEALRGVRGDLQKVGGSHAQRDVFSRLMIEAAIRAGRYEEAEAELVARARRRGAEDGFVARRRASIARAGNGASIAGAENGASIAGRRGVALAAE